jgi:regulatory protein
MRADGRLSTQICYFWCILKQTAMPSDIVTPLQAQKKLEHFCAYQDRCHAEVVDKLRGFGLENKNIDEIVVYLIGQNFLNEERFAKSFARGKHRIKHWGKIRIVNELKFRGISQYNINTALKEIDPDEYLQNFDALAQRCWENLREPNLLRKKKKCLDFLFRKGYENQLIYDKLELLTRTK